MSNGFVILKSVGIKSIPLKVWDILTDPGMIKQYFTGAETITDWLIGSDILFNHEYEGEKFTNKGKILRFQPQLQLVYSYWTKFSQTEDLPENYTTISYTLRERNNVTTLSLRQTNIKNLQWFDGLQAGWDTVLAKIKEIAED